MKKRFKDIANGREHNFINFVIAEGNGETKL